MSAIKIGIFADVQNIYYTTREAFGRQFNYRAFWNIATADTHVEFATAYATEPQDGKQKGFQQILKDIGFTVLAKPYVRRRDGSAKGDWDVGIALDMIEFAPRLDRLVLVSGDGDFDLAIKRVNERYDCQTIVCGVRKLTAKSLIDQADQYIEIDETLLI